MKLIFHINYYQLIDKLSKVHNFSANINLSKTQIFGIIQMGGSLGALMAVTDAVNASGKNFK